MILTSILLLAYQGQNPVVQPAPTTNTNQATQTAAAKPVVKINTYSSDELGLAFDYPPDWKKSKVKVKNDAHIVITDPKTWRPAKQDITSRFLIPLPGVDERAVLEVYSDIFNQDQDTWQTVQKDINDQLHRTIVRQWSEELLGVPLLMTKIESKDKGLDRITETGLLYSATPRKMIFRLSASPDNFDKADYAWRQVLESLRTTSGKLPSAEDPNRKMSPADLVPGNYHQVIWTAPTAHPTLPWKGEQILTGETAGKKVSLKGPTGWKAAKNADGTYNLTCPDVAGIVKLTLSNDLDSDPAGRMLIRNSSATLQDFGKVEKRDEKGPYTNRGQANVDYIFRRGQDGRAKPLYSFDAAGVSGDDYWLVTWSSSDPGSIGKGEKALENLADNLFIEPAH